MLNPSTRNLIKATVPVLREHGTTLTRHFYARMFQHNPELKAVFNQGHQHAGQQQQALAMAVLAYAENIDDPSVLQPVLTHIAHKHVSLGIRAEHYAIVGQHLLASIKEVLGDAASEELIHAWAAAYGQLAGLMIEQENTLYAQAATQVGGWTHWRRFNISKKVAESSEISSFYLTPADGGQVPGYRPGQYLSVRVFVPELGLDQPRQYSLSAAPGNDYLRISVKREAGRGDTPAGMVSNLLHHDFHEGDSLEISVPMGDYFLHEDRTSPVVLISAGVGLTPKMAMLEHLIKQQSARQIRFIHACRGGAVHAFKHRLRELANAHKSLKQVIYYETPTPQDQAGIDYHHAGRINLAEIAHEVVLNDADYYICGPRMFMQTQAAALRDLGVDRSRIHMEVFGTGGVAH